MTLRLATLLAGTIAATLATAATASTVLNFEDLPFGFTVVPSNYAGLNWGNNFVYYSSPQDPYNASSPPNRIFGNYELYPSGPASIPLIVGAGSVFDGLWLAGANGAQVGFDLYSGGSLVASATPITMTSVPTFLASGYAGGIDRIVINTSFNGFWVADDLTFSVLNPAGNVPEPASWAMLIAGFGLTGAVLRRRRSLAVA